MGRGRPGRRVPDRSAEQAVAETGDIFFSLFLCAVSAAVGAVGAILLLAVLGPGARSPVAAALGMAGGFVVGVLATMLTSWHVLVVTARARWLRRRLESVWLAYDGIAPALIGGATTLFIARL